jgi:hypothetical protein
MVTKKGRNEETMEENFQHKKVKEMAHEKGNKKIKGGLGMHDFSIFAEQMPYLMINKPEHQEGQHYHGTINSHVSYNKMRLVVKV